MMTSFCVPGLLHAGKWHVHIGNTLRTKGETCYLESEVYCRVLPPADIRNNGIVVLSSPPAETLGEVNITVQTRIANDKWRTGSCSLLLLLPSIIPLISCSKMEVSFLPLSTVRFLPPFFFCHPPIYFYFLFFFIFLAQRYKVDNWIVYWESNSNWRPTLYSCDRELISPVRNSCLKGKISKLAKSVCYTHTHTHTHSVLLSVLYFMGRASLCAVYSACEASAVCRIYSPPSIKEGLKITGMFLLLDVCLVLPFFSFFFLFFLSNKRQLCVTPLLQPYPSSVLWNI